MAKPHDHLQIYHNISTEMGALPKAGHLGLSHHSANAPRGHGSHGPIHEAPILGALGNGGNSGNQGDATEKWPENGWKAWPIGWDLKLFSTSSGWWLGHPSEKYQSIGMIIPNIWENKIDVPNHQPVLQWKMLDFQELSRAELKFKMKWRYKWEWVPNISGIEEFSHGPRSPSRFNFFSQLGHLNCRCLLSNNVIIQEAQLKENALRWPKRYLLPLSA